MMIMLIAFLKKIFTIGRISLCGWVFIKIVCGDNSAVLIKGDLYALR